MTTSSDSLYADSAQARGLDENRGSLLRISDEEYERREALFYQACNEKAQRQELRSKDSVKKVLEIIDKKLYGRIESL